jgi:anti-sigma B factor antagonist
MTRPHAKEEQMHEPAAQVLARSLGRGQAVVTVSGRVDERAADALRDAFAALTAPGLCELVVDLSAATELDSIALGSIAHGAKRAASVGGRLRVAGAGPELERLLRITGLQRVLAAA